MRTMIENPMVVDSLWTVLEKGETQVVGECAGCGEDIYEGQDIYDCEGELIHQNEECCSQYVSNRSWCKVAGE